MESIFKIDFHRWLSILNDYPTIYSNDTSKKIISQYAAMIAVNRKM